MSTSKSRYDVVLVDSPALLPVADATVLARACDAALLVKACPRCLSRVFHGHKHCPECGAELGIAATEQTHADRACPRCGISCKVYAALCTRCGMELEYPEEHRSATIGNAAA